MKLSRFLKYCQNLQMLALGKIVRFRFTDREYIVTGKCYRCGQCCQDIHLKYDGNWIRTSRQFAELLGKHPQYSRFHLCSEQHPGEYLRFTCNWYDIKLGCSNYNNRLDICKSYPQKTLPAQGRKLPPGCGYSIGKGIPFRRHLANEMKKYNRK